MQALIALLAICLIALPVILIPLIFNLSQQVSASGMMKSIARHFSGDVMDRGRWLPPAVEFMRQGVRFRVLLRRPRQKRSSTILQVSTGWPDRHWRVSIIPESISTHLKKLMGVTETTIGQPAFDSTYFLQTNDEKQLKSKLGPAVQQAFDQVNALSHGASFRFSILAGDISLETQISLRGSGDAQQVVEAFTNIYFQLSAFDQTAISVRGVSFDANTATCLVCGDQILEHRVECRSCRTPHHEDCWKFVGMCATFACGDTVFVSRIPSRRDRVWIR